MREQLTKKNDDIRGKQMIIYRQNQLFTFLLYCNGVDAQKTILDCGGGGKLPPLGIFKEAGYQTTGIDISERALEWAEEFQRKNNLDLNIKKGNMMNLEFEDEEFSFAYSYNTIFHMSKDDIISALKEMKRVVKSNGLIFVNFVSTEDERFGKGEKVREKQFLEVEHGEKVLHTYFDENEAEEIFKELGLKLVYKEYRKRKGPKQSGGYINLSFIDYIVEKE